MSSNKMSKDDSSRIQATQEKNGGDMSSAGFASRAQSAGDRASNASANTSSGGSNNAGSSAQGGNNGAHGGSAKK